MFSWLAKKAASVGVGGILEGANGIVETVMGSQKERDQMDHDAQTAVVAAHASEFIQRSNRTWWDSFIDGINRLPRPMMTFGTMAFIWYAIYDPEEFTYAIQALTIVPTPLWVIFGTIVGFWFAGKFAAKDFRNMKPNLQALKEVLAHRRMLDESKVKDKAEPKKDEKENKDKLEAKKESLRNEGTF